LPPHAPVTYTADVRALARLYIDKLRVKYPSLARSYSLALDQGPQILANDTAFQLEYQRAKQFDFRLIELLDMATGYSRSFGGSNLDGGTRYVRTFGANDGPERR
jgi:hypothetical protein